MSPVWDEPSPWPILDPAARYGLAGDLLDAVLPETEADPAALVFTLLTMIGSMAGKDMYAFVAHVAHPARLFTAIVGDTSDGAKGTSFALMRLFFDAADPKWVRSRNQGGFGSGESIAAAFSSVGDGSVDPRLLISEPEFARILTVNGRESSTSSMTIRAAYDGTPLEARRSKERSVVVDHHVSVLGQITPRELRKKLTESDCSNGFANRFVFVASRRSKMLPYGGHIADSVIVRFAERLCASREYARGRGAIPFSPAAMPVWDALCRGEPTRTGLVSEITARFRPNMLRMAVAYAILDLSACIEPAHLRAAEACWRYSVATVQHIFGSSNRADKVQDRLLAGLRAVYGGGLTGTQQAELFSRNLKAGELATARKILERDGLIRSEESPGGPKGGRIETISFAVPPRETKKTN